MIFDPAYYSWDALALLYFMAALGTFVFGAGIMLYERFAGTSRRFFLVSVITAGWLAPLGMAALAADETTARLWLRIAFSIDPLTAPALYWFVSGVAQVGRPRLQRAAWLAGGVLGALSMAGPWVVLGLESLTQDRTLAGWGWLGAVYFSFVLGVVVIAVRDLARNRKRAATREEREETVLLTAAASIASLTLLDYWIQTDPFRVGLLTPVVIVAALTLAAVVAGRYRVFLLARSFGTDAVLRSMSDVVLVCDSAGRVRGSNPAAGQLLGRSEEALLSSGVNELFGYRGEPQRERWSLDPETPQRDLDLEMRTQVGGVAVSVSTEPLTTAGRVVGAVVVARDMEERLEAERAMRAIERRYSSLFWHNPGILYEFDLAGHIVALNPAGERLMGRTSAELEGRSFSELLDPGAMDQARAVFAAVMAGESTEYEITARNGQGEPVEIRGVSVPIFEKGEVVAGFGIALDVTEQTRVKRELEVQRRYFADLFEASPEGIVLVDAETDSVLRVNSEFTRMFGYTAEEAVGRNLNDLIVPPELQREGSQLNLAAREGGRLRTETVRCHKDGTPVDVSVLARSLPIPGEREQLYGVYRDIGDRIETERTLREREEELRHAQKLEAVGKLAGGIAHDFNNLLTVINGHARFALDGISAEDPLQQDLLEIEKAGTRAASLTQQLLAYSRRQVLHPQMLDPNAIVLEVNGMLRRLIGEHIRVETRLTQEDVRVRADRGQLEQVLMNLVVNARDAMPDGGTITLETDALTLEPDDPRIGRWQVTAGRFVRIRVSDTGTGMDATTLAHAFEPFFTTKEQGKGTGLGLATVFGIVKQSGGHVLAESEPGQGTRCDVILPHVEVTAPVGVAGSAAEIAVDPPQGTILVVEDEAAVRKLAVRVLERAGCTVLAAENGADALRVIEAHDGEIDLVVTDMVMPDMGGRELALHLRRQRPGLPVLFMSGYDEELLADSIADSAFLAKPFTPAALTAAVAEAMRTAPTT